MLGLGEFETSGFSESSRNVMLWAYFCMATFLTQIIFMNTLIAILGGTYTKVMDNKQKFALKERASIYSDYLHLISPAESLSGAKFVYIVTPIADTCEDSEEVFEEIKDKHHEAAKN